jgi:DNA helicase II / ATP-dependent DNA helicase PcrA
MNFLDDLNAQQLEAVESTEGPLLILAGAGSGKTRVITYRIAHLVRNRLVNPDQILAVTFTNKAADEMKGRVLRLLGDQAKRVWISTFHSACVRILRKEIQRLGYQQDFMILDYPDQIKLVKECVKELNINEELYDPKEISRRISRLKNQLDAPESYAQECQPFGMEDKVAKVYSQYQRRLRGNNSLDFDDLLMLTAGLFEANQQVLDLYRERFRYLMIDEYQDTNHAQYRLVRLLGGHENVCVVGDDDQSIYGFRGADLENILRFEKDYPTAKVIRLEQNYRSTQTILAAAGVVVGQNRNRKSKQLWTQNTKGGDVILCQVSDEEAEAHYIGKTVKQLVSGGNFHYKDAAILYRTHAQSRALEEGLREEGVPYRIVGGVRFYERKEIKDVVAYLKVLVHPEDDLSLKRIMNVPPRGLGQMAIEKLEAHARSSDIPLSQAVNEVLNLSNTPSGFTPAQKKSLRQLVDLLEELRQAASKIPLTELLRLILHRTGYEQMLQREAAEKTSKGGGRSRLENIQELCSATQVFERRVEDVPESHETSLPAFLDHVALVANSPPDEAGSTGDDKEEDASKVSMARKGAVQLMTFHSAKGLEFPLVLLAGMEEGLFPHHSALTDSAQMEEERRLCYVGMTRAREILQLIYADRRRLYGSIQRNSPSRFVREIPDEFVREILWDDLERKPARYPSIDLAKQPQKTIVPTGPFSEGVQVRHPLWGVGWVRVAEGHGEDQKVVVHFRSVGTKKLAVSHARLEKVDSVA